MKKTLLVLTAGLALYATSCSKSTTETKATPETVAQNKQTMETAGVDFVNELNAMKDSKSMTAIKNLSSLNIKLKSSLPFSGIIDAILSGSQSGTLKALKSGLNVDSALQTVYGTYTYVAAVDSFSSAKGGNYLSIKFPSDSTKTTNNAEIKVYDVAFTTVSSTEVPYTSILTSAKAYLKIDGSDVITYTLTAAYDSDGLPTSLSTSLAIDTYSFNYDFSHSSTKLKSDMSIKNGTKMLLAEGMEFNGTVTLAKAKEIETYYKDTTNKDNLTKVGEFVEAATVYYQVMDIKIIGSVDALNFTKSFDALSKTDKDNFNQKDADIVNKYCSLYAIFSSTNKKIADVSIYPKTVDKLNYAGQATGQTEINPALMLTFPDGSKSDLQTYIDDPNNFKSVKDDLQKFADELNGKTTAKN